MSNERDVTRSVRSWLRTDEQDSADRVLEAVLDALDTTPQRRRSWWPARRVDHLNALVKYGLVAACAYVCFLGGVMLVCLRRRDTWVYLGAGTALMYGSFTMLISDEVGLFILFLLMSAVAAPREDAAPAPPLVPVRARA